MIVRYVGDKRLADVEALCLELRTRDKDGRLGPARSPATVRKHCASAKVGKDLVTGRSLYDMSEAEKIMSKVEEREPRRRSRRS